ncbi:MAG: DEAD/DEAH box helicase, partial [Actinomycetota bacterium]
MVLPPIDDAGFDDAGFDAAGFDAADPLDAHDLLAPLADLDQLVGVHVLPGRTGRRAETARPFGDALGQHPASRGLWAHQARAVDLLRTGEPVVVATGTGSGKSRCFQLPIAEAARRGHTALVLFPTKALAHDQRRSWTDLELPGVVACTYDGDSDDDERTRARREANVVLTNPEMVHYGICANHDRWRRFLSRVRYVVIDELHALRGVFGSHVGNVVRRLLRLIRHHGGDPIPVACSATIGAPGALMRELTGVEATVIDDDAAPRPPVTVALWDTPIPPGGHRRISADVESARISAELIRQGLRTLTFCRSRRGAEQVALDIATRVDDSTPVRVYRAGLLAEERRVIEEELTSGELGGVVATSALELGIDVGALDAVVLDGFPGTVSSFRQRIGRVGRAGRPALAVLVAGSDQLDRWMLRHPDHLLARPAERVVANVDNPFVVLPHLGCASYELPLRPVGGGGGAGAAGRRGPGGGWGGAGGRPTRAPRHPCGVDRADQLVAVAVDDADRASAVAAQRDAMGRCGGCLPHGPPVADAGIAGPHQLTDPVVGGGRRPPPPGPGARGGGGGPPPRGGGRPPGGGGG